MLHKGDICTYIPSGRAVIVHRDQNSGEWIPVVESDVGNPEWIRGIHKVRPLELRRRPHNKIS